MREILTIARYVLVEARRSSLGWLALVCMLATGGAAAFAGQVALMEARELQAAGAGALLRLCAAFLIASHVVASATREANDRGLELALALPLSRGQYYFGKLAGFSACGVLLASGFSLPMLLWAAPAAVAAWWISLALETALIAALALFFAVLLVQVVPALAATAAVYLLGRSIASIQAIAAGPVVDGKAFASAFDALALVLPRLDRATRTEWLVYGAPSPEEWFAALANLSTSIALAAAAGLFDFSRRNA